MTRTASLAIVGMIGLYVGACMNTEFLAGVRCTRDDDCGRSLECDGGVCGGCPDDTRGPDGRCDCPGNRLLDCVPVEPDDPCVAVCASEIEQCAVAVRDAEGNHTPVDPCTETSSDTTCFRIEIDAAACEPGEAEVSLEPAPAVPPVLLVNCPPPATEDGRFDCP